MFQNGCNGIIRVFLHGSFCLIVIERGNRAGHADGIHVHIMLPLPPRLPAAHHLVDDEDGHKHYDNGGEGRHGSYNCGLSQAGSDGDIAG